MPIPATCKDFVEHPHLVNGRGCYNCQCASASEIQGTSQIAEALIALGIPVDVHQTGGFTMCVYINTGGDSFIYANTEGLAIYTNDDDEEPESLFFGDDFNEQTPAQKADKIANVMKEKNLIGKDLN
jgi:hypothetical protein